MKKHIFLVDDVEDDIKDFMKSFNSVGIPFKCTWAKSGEQALQQLAYLTPDIIILDSSLPDMDGLKFLMEIKGIDKLMDIPVVLYSSITTEDYKARAFSLGAFACLKKSDCLSELKYILGHLVEGPTADAEC